MKAYKHHISENFTNGKTEIFSGPAKGSTIFLDYDKMVEYLREDGREWHVCEIVVEKQEYILNFGNDYMATILVDKHATKPFEKLVVNKR